MDGPGLLRGGHIFPTVTRIKEGGGTIGSSELVFQL